MPNPIFNSDDEAIFKIRTTASGPTGALPFTGSFLKNSPSGNVFGWTQNTGMGWDPSKIGRPEFLMLSTSGGIRQPDGTPTALGFHTGHWEVGLLMEEAAKVFTEHGGIPFAAFCSDPCDGRTQGTTGMFDSLAYRNDAAIVLRRLTRSLPTAKGMMGVATCDKGLPAMMMALAGNGHLPGILVPGGVTLLSEEGEDLAKVQSVGARFAHDEIDLKTASETACRSCGSPGGGCQFLGTAATCQVVAESPRHDPPARRARPQRFGSLARHGSPIRLRPDDHDEGGNTALLHPHRSLLPQRPRSPRGLRWIHQSHSAPSRHRSRCGSPPPHGGRLAAHQSEGPPPRGCPAQRSSWLCHRASLPRWRST